MFHYCGAESGGDLAHLVDDKRVLQRVHQRVGQAQWLAGIAQTRDDELFAKWDLIDDRRTDHFAIKHDGDTVYLRTHVLGQGDHLVRAGTVEGDVNGIGLLL